MSAQSWFTDLVGIAGITPNGPHAYDPQILNPRFYSRVRWGGLLALGRSFEDRDWTCDDLPDFFRRLLEHKVQERVGLSLPLVWIALKARILNLQSVRRAFQVGKRHYDLDNKLFERMLGKTMAYSCAFFWLGADNLDEAQYAKFKFICDKLKLKPGMRILDIGCGSGGFAKYAAEHYGVSVVGLTVSQEQAKYARELCQGWPVEILLQDYRRYQAKQPFDRVVSVGMWEHVGVKNYRRAMVATRQFLKPDGLFLLQTIGSLKSSTTPDPYMEAEIFRNSKLPSFCQITRSAEGLFLLEHADNHGYDYALTLSAWRRNFVEAWPELVAHNPDLYNERFFRKWSYYLQICEGAFLARHIQLWQIVFSPNGVPGGYEFIR